MLDPAVQLELLHAFAYELYDETQAAQLALHAFPRLSKALLVRAVATAGEVAGCFHSARELWLPPFADGLYEQYPLLANLRVREAFVKEYLSVVAVQAATSNASPLQLLLMELVWSGCGPFSGLSGNR